MSTIPPPVREQLTTFVHMHVYTYHGANNVAANSLKPISNFKDNKSKKPDFAENQRERWILYQN